MAGSSTHVSERAERTVGGSIRKDVHLDRMAAYLVAMNGDPNKPEVAAMKTAQSIGVGYLFTDVCEKAPVVTNRLNYHLDRMAENTGMTCVFTQLGEKGTGVATVPTDTFTAWPPTLSP